MPWQAFIFSHMYIYIHILCSTQVPLVCEGCASKMSFWAKKWGWRRWRLPQCFSFFPPFSPSILQSKSQVQNCTLITRVEKYKLCIWCRASCTMHNSLCCCCQLKTGEMKMSISCLPAQRADQLTSKVSLLQALILKAWPQFAYEALWARGGIFQGDSSSISWHLILMMKMISSVHGILCAEVTDISITFAAERTREFSSRKTFMDALREGMFSMGRNEK